MRRTLTAAVAALTLLLAALDMAALGGRPAAVDMAAPEAELVSSGVHAPERDGPRGFRWSAGRAEVRLLDAGLAGERILGVALGAGAPGIAPPALTVTLNGAQLTSFQPDGRPRRYLLLAPAGLAPAGQATVGLASDTVTVAPDPRPLGVRVEAVTLAAPGGALPTPPIVLAYALGLGGLAFTLRRTGWELRAILAALGLAALGLALAARLPPAVVAPIYTARLAGASLALAGLTALLLPAIERHLGRLGSPQLARALWGAALLACGVRLVGTLYPPFDAYDLSLNLGRFARTVGGTLLDTNRSFEFRSGVTVYPSGPYLALMPGVLAGLTPKLAVQGGIALLDALGALATGALALRLELPRRAALFAALLYATLPVMLTSLWFGHTAQVFGQGLMAPLALALLDAFERDRPRAWLVAGALLSMALLSHIGVTILAVAWVGLAWLALGRELPRRAWLRFGLALLISGIVGLAMVYGPEARLKIAELGKVSERVSSGGAPAYNLIWAAIRISFYDIGWLLAPLGLVIMPWARLPRGGRALGLAWVGAAALFWAVELATALQVRYLVMLAPLACIAVGAAFGQLARRGRAGVGVAWAATAGLLSIGAATWFLGVYQNVQMSMVPLLR